MMGGKSGSSVRPRPGGGMNQGLGQFGEHLDEAAMGQAIAQKVAGQAGASAKPGSAANSKLPPSSVSHQQQSPLDALAPSELKQAFTQPAKELSKGFIDQLLQASGLDFLGIDSGKEVDQEEAQRLQIIAGNYQRLNEEQQAVARANFERELARKRAMEEEAQQAKAAKEEAAAAEAVMPPSSPKNGPIGPAGSDKQRAVTQLQQNRQRLGQPQSAN